MPIKDAIQAFKQLDSEDIRILQVIERGMITHEYVDTRLIVRLSKNEEDFVLSRLKKLNRLGLVQRTKQPYVGYILTSRGYDCLAFNALLKRATLKAITATPLGEGKESEVYLGLTPGGRKVAVKIHRVGRTSFRHTRKVRVYAAEKRHLSWLYLSRLAAKQEYEALKILYGRVSVPEPIDWNRHVVVTEYINGVELYKVPELSNPSIVLEKILEEVKRSYKAGIVHGDLSEYNVMVTEGENVVIFDWPQWISSSNPHAIFYVKRDLVNILNFFKRKYFLKINVERMVEDFLNTL